MDNTSQGSHSRHTQFSRHSPSSGGASSTNKVVRRRSRITSTHQCRSCSCQWGRSARYSRYLSTLSAIIPKTLAKKIAFLLTNTSNPLFQNFSGDALEEGFKDAPQFLPNNPIALHRRCLELKDAPNTMSQAHIFRKAAKASEQDALGPLLFNWRALSQSCHQGLFPAVRSCRILWPTSLVL